MTVSGSKCYFSHTLNANIRLLANKEKCLLREVQITVLLCVCMFRVPYCDVRYVFRIKQCSGRLYLLFLVGGIMSYLRYLCLFENSGVQHIFFCVFVLFVYLRLMCRMFPVSLGYPFLIAPSIFSSVYVLLSKT